MIKTTRSKTILKRKNGISHMAVIACVWVLLSTHTMAAKLVTKDIQFSGLSHITTANLNLDTLNTKIGSQFSQSNLDLDTKQLYLTGFFQAVSAIPTLKGQQVSIEFKCTENPIITDIVITGNTTFKNRELIDLMQNKIGTPLNIKWVESDKNAIQNHYKLNGFTLMEVSKIDMNATVLTVKIREVYIDSFTLTGLKKLTPQTVLTRDLRSHPGTVFNTAYLQEDRSFLIRTGYFNTLSIPEIKEDIANNKVAISIAATERKSTNIEIGLEQEQKDVVAFTKAKKRHLLIPTDEFSTKLQFSNNNTTEIRLRSYNLDYYQPWIFNRFNVGFRTRTWATFERERLTADTHFKTAQTYNTRRDGFDVGLDFPIIRQKLTVSSIYRQEKVYTTDPTSLYENEANKPETYYTKRATLLVNYKGITNIFNPKNGSYGTLELEKGNDIGIAKLGGLTDSRQTVNSAFFYSPTSKSTIGFRSYVGRYVPNSQGINTFDNENFEIGGVMSLRGYKENYQFGNKKILFNLEYRYDLTKKVQTVLFYDTGRAFDDAWSLQHLDYGRGIGFRYFSPIGPFRLDIGWGDAMIIHFSLGQMF